jgi:putative ABC transport system permease protein
MIKDTLREIRKSLGRFISLFAICFIGVAFFAGVTASSGDMKHSSDLYYDEYNLCDIEVMSSTGFSEDDVRLIRDTEGVNGVYATHRMDAVTSLDGIQMTMRVMTVPDGDYDAENPDYINQLRLKEGRLPEAEDECVVRYSEMSSNPINIGDVITLTSGTDLDIAYQLERNEYKVVGIVYTPYYISYDVGSSDVGTGKVNYVMYIYDSCFRGNIYTDVFATVDGAKELDCYSDEYEDLVESVTDRLNEDWYILDRNSIYSFVDYESSADRMDKIAMVFPVFFILVAALCCLTTMTRMVDEQRQLIGTYKALGYSKFSIAMKYISYSFTASVLGGITGCIFGLRVFPYIIYNCWNIIYFLPDIQYGEHYLLSFVAIASITGVIVIATVWACINELAEVPASLLRPKSPKNGKKIILEHIGFIWNRFNFSAKVTARNILRYKKRFYMTAVGVAGGCALMFAGFAIKDSISALVVKQYEEIIKSDITITYTGDDTVSRIADNKKITDYIKLYQNTVTVSSSDNEDDKDYAEKENIYLNVTISAEDFQDYIMLRKRGTNTTYLLDDEGVCITEKAAKDLGVKAGDSIYIHMDDEVKEFKVSHVTEMYSNNYVYMTTKVYRDVYGENPDYNCLYAKIDSEDDNTANVLGKELLDIDGVKGVVFSTANVSKFNDMISTMNLVTYILIISAAALSFVVLYNLTNVNISERIREIATIKVLGFYDGEVANYVYRENLIITLIGAFFGIFLGMALHRYIMITVEMDNIMFGNAVKPVSYILSYVITVFFSLIVNIVMYGKLKKIPMVESLKAVE